MPRLVGLDIGDKRIGVAVSDGLGLTAQPIGVVQRRSQKADTAALVALLEGYEVAEFVAGMPMEMDGREGEQADRVRHFCLRLGERTGLPITFEDERLTSRLSERTLIDAGVRRGRRRKVIDKVAAVLILQARLDRGQGDLSIPPLPAKTDA